MPTFRPKDFWNLYDRLEKVTIFGYALRDRIVILSFEKELATKRPHPWKIIELPLDASADQLLAAAILATFENPSPMQAEAGVREVKKLPFYADIRPQPRRKNDSPYVCRATRNGVAFTVQVACAELWVDSFIPIRHMFSTRFRYAAAAKRLGPALEEAIRIARDPPETRFSWECVADLRISNSCLSLASRYHDGLDQYDCTLDLMPRDVGDVELGSAVFKALHHRATITKKTAAVAAHRALQRRPEYRKHRRWGGAGIWVSFSGAHDRNHLEVAPIGHGGFTMKGDFSPPKPVSVDCDAATLGAEIRRRLIELGVTTSSNRTPELPIDRLFAPGGYRGLIVNNKKKQSQIHAAVQALKKANLIAWSEKLRELGEASPCALRLRESCVDDLPALMARLRVISAQSRAELTLALATRSTDIFVYAKFSNGKAVRVLTYGVPEQHSWSEVLGSPLEWEGDVLEQKVTSKRSKCIITDAMTVASRALHAAYR